MKIQTDTIFSMNKQSTQHKPMSPIILSNNFIFTAYGAYAGTNNNIMFKTLCAINGTTINVEKDNCFIDKNIYAISGTLLTPDNKVLIIYTDRTNQYLYGKVGYIKSNIVNKAQNSSDTIIGIAKTNGTSGNQVEVITPVVG